MTNDEAQECVAFSKYFSLFRNRLRTAGDGLCVSTTLTLKKQNKLTNYEKHHHPRHRRLKLCRCACLAGQRLLPGELLVHEDHRLPHGMPLGDKLLRASLQL